MSSFLYLGIEKDVEIPTLVCARSETLDSEYNIMSLIKYRIFVELTTAYGFSLTPVDEDRVTPINPVFSFEKPLLALPVEEPLFYFPFLYPIQ